MNLELHYELESNSQSKIKGVCICVLKWNSMLDINNLQCLYQQVLLGLDRQFYATEGTLPLQIRLELSQCPVYLKTSVTHWQYMIFGWFHYTWYTIYNAVTNRMQNFQIQIFFNFVASQHLISEIGEKGLEKALRPLPNTKLELCIIFHQNQATNTCPPKNRPWLRSTTYWYNNSTSS